MYAHPFSADYWRDASREVRDLRKLLFSALMIALCIVLAQVPSVPLFGGAKVTWGFLARSVCAWVCGPVLGLLFAFAEDILSFFLTDLLHCLDHIILSLICSFYTDFPLKISMFRTKCQTQVRLWIY